jgi:hypothetical protein
VRTRSPGYPSSSLGDALEYAKKIHDVNRTNPIDREAAAKDMGYTGLTGRSAKVLADLSHFGLLEKAGKGGVRVSRCAVDILYPATPAGRRTALIEAAFAPTLFSELNDHFLDGVPSENALRSYLMRHGFASAAIPPVVNGYLETCRLIQQEGASESHGDGEEYVEESLGSKTALVVVEDKTAQAVRHPATSEPRQTQEVRLSDGERVIFVDEAGPGQYLKLVASGELDVTLLEALEDFTKRWKKRLSPGAKGSTDGESGKG